MVLGAMGVVFLRRSVVTRDRLGLSHHRHYPAALRLHAVLPRTL